MGEGWATRLWTHAWVLVGLYSCATIGTPPAWIMWLPTAAACAKMRTVIMSGDLPFIDERPAYRWECRPAEATQEAGECQSGTDWGR